MFGTETRSLESMSEREKERARDRQADRQQTYRQTGANYFSDDVQRDSKHELLFPSETIMLINK